MEGGFSQAKFLVGEFSGGRIFLDIHSIIKFSKIPYTPKTTVCIVQQLEILSTVKQTLHWLLAFAFLKIKLSRK